MEKPGLKHKRKGFLRVRVVELYNADPRWGTKLGELVMDVRHWPFKAWFVLAVRLNGGFDNLKVRVVE